MDPISDYFISYNNDITVKQEKLPDSEVSLNQYLPFNKNSHSVYPLMLVQSAQNILNQTDLAMKKPAQGNSTFPWKGKKPFKISNCY